MQATVGKCNVAKPGMMDFVGKAKWEAWNTLGDMSQVCSDDIFTNQLRKDSVLFCEIRFNDRTSFAFISFADFVSQQSLLSLASDIHPSIYLSVCLYG